MSDHLRKRPYVADVLLYDKVVLPLINSKKIMSAGAALAGRAGRGAAKARTSEQAAAAAPSPMG